VERTDKGQEMEIPPLLTSVENRGAPGHFLRKIFFRQVKRASKGNSLKATKGNAVQPFQSCCSSENSDAPAENCIDYLSSEKD